MLGAMVIPQQDGIVMTVMKRHIFLLYVKNLKHDEANNISSNNSKP